MFSAWYTVIAGQTDSPQFNTKLISGTEPKRVGKGQETLFLRLELFDFLPVNTAGVFRLARRIVLSMVYMEYLVPEILYL